MSAQSPAVTGPNTIVEVERRQVGMPTPQLGFGIGDGIFGTTFYTLTGFHGAHVFGGAVGLTILLARSVQGQFSARNHIAVEAISMYWHFVDVVWIALFTTLYFLR